MKSFDLPDVKDLKKLIEVLKEREDGGNKIFFSQHGAGLETEWKSYLRLKSDVTIIQPDRLPWAEKKKSFINLYPGSDGQTQYDYISKMRVNYDSDDYLICPYCGRPEFDGFDHYLPKTRYPEFSILSKNLVPSCGKCNELKGNTIPVGKDEYFVHPYYDDELSKQLIYYKFNKPYENFSITLKVVSTVPSKIKKRLRFQMRQLDLRSRLKKEARRELRSLIELLDKEEWVSYHDLITHLERGCRSEYSRYKSENSPIFIVYQSILSDVDYLSFLKKRGNLN